VRFLSIYKHVETNAPPTPEEMERMGSLIEEGIKGGWLLGTEGCLPSALGARVRRSKGRVTVTDGPFTESKELVGGFAILEANSREDAIELCRHFLEVAGDGECELRQLYDAPAVAPDAGAAHKAYVDQVDAARADPSPLQQENGLPL
jgi:hypothetical protein